MAKAMVGTDGLVRHELALPMTNFDRSPEAGEEQQTTRQTIHFHTRDVQSIHFPGMDVERQAVGHSPQRIRPPLAKAKGFTHLA